MIVDGFVKTAERFSQIEQIAGVATAGIAYGALVADKMRLPFAYVRSNAKTHGRQNLIEGQVDQGANVLVIEDLISTGGSSLAAVEALREAGCTVLGVLAIFQYNFPEAQERFSQAQCPFQTLSDFLTLIKVAKNTGHIRESDIEFLSLWYTDPKAWQARVVSN